MKRLIASLLVLLATAVLAADVMNTEIPFSWTTPAAVANAQVSRFYIYEVENAVPVVPAPLVPNPVIDVGNAMARSAKLVAPLSLGLHCYSIRSVSSIGVESDFFTPPWCMTVSAAPFDSRPKPNPPGQFRGDWWRTF